MVGNNFKSEVLCQKVLQARHDHFLQIDDLAALSGLSEVQIKSLEEGSIKNNCFIDESHTIDCAKRLAISLGFPENHFLKKANNLYTKGKKGVRIKNNPSDMSFKYSRGRIEFEEENVLKKLDVITQEDFSLVKRQIHKNTTNETSLFWGLLSTSPSLMAPFVIILIGVFFFFLDLLIIK